MGGWVTETGQMGLGKSISAVENLHERKGENIT